MASELELKLTWENKGFFQLTGKRDAEATITIIRIEENGHIADLWPAVEEICKKFLAASLTEIGNEMKET